MTDRRRVLVGGAAATAAAWVTPQILSTDAAAAATVVDPCANPSVGYFQNFNVMNGEFPPGQSYRPYGPGEAIADWTVTAGPTITVDITRYGVEVGTGNFTDTAPSPPVIIDLAGTPGPGGITRTLLIPCPALHTVTFEWMRTTGVAGDTTLTVTGADPDPAVFTFPQGPGSGLVSVATLDFTTTTANTAVTLTFQTTNGSVGNIMVANISVS